jgi:hypothetical protein
MRSPTARLIQAPLFQVPGVDAGALLNPNSRSRDRYFNPTSPNTRHAAVTYREPQGEAGAKCGKRSVGLGPPRWPRRSSPPAASSHPCRSTRKMLRSYGGLRHDRLRHSPMLPLIVTIRMTISIVKTTSLVTTHLLVMGTTIHITGTTFRWGLADAASLVAAASTASLMELSKGAVSTPASTAAASTAAASKAGAGIASRAAPETSPRRETRSTRVYRQQGLVSRSRCGFR